MTAVGQLSVEAIENKFAAVEDSIGWAEDAARELHSLIQGFFNGDVARIVTDTDAETGQHTQKLKLTADIPKSFRRKATEALVTARHSFDQSLFAAKSVVSPRPPKGILYPWSTNPSDLERLFDLRGIDECLRQAIRAHEPYPTSDAHTGGDDLIRSLASIANNKHTVGLTVDAQISFAGFPDIQGREVEALDIIAPFWNAQKKEAELMRWKGDLEIRGDYQITFHVALKESRLAQPVDVIFALRTFTGKAKEVCESLKTACLACAS